MELWPGIASFMDGSVYYVGEQRFVEQIEVTGEIAVRFRPYSFTIRPHLGIMLASAGITSVETDKTREAEGGMVLARHGLTGYAISDADGLPLIHWPRFFRYSRGFSFAEELDTVALETIDAGPGALSLWHPECALSYTEDGDSLRLGIAVHSDWWAHHKPTSLDGFTVEGWRTGWTKLVFSTLPADPRWWSGEMLTNKSLAPKAWAVMDGWNMSAEEWSFRHRWASVELNRYLE